MPHVLKPDRSQSVCGHFIEGFGLALERCGIPVVASVEIDPDCRGVIARHFPRTTLFSDVTEVTGDQLRRAGFAPRRGVLTAGFPCQDLSVAGRRAGLGGARSGLFWQVVRLADEMLPQWVILENVAGLLSAVCSCPGDGTCAANGRLVRCPGDGSHPVVPGGACAGGCMERHGGAMGAVVGALEQLGYGVCWRVLDSRYFGVPQRRERVFIVGCLGDGAAPVEVLLEPEGGRGHPAARREAGPGTAGGADGVADGAGITGALTAGMLGDYDDNTARGGFMVTAPTITAGWGTNHGSPGHGGKDQAALAVIAATLQGGGRRGHRIDAEGAAGGHLIPLPSREVIACDTSREGKGPDSDATSGFVVAHALTSEGADASEDGAGGGTPLVPMAFNPQTGGSKALLGYAEKPTALQASQVTAVHMAATNRALPGVAAFSENQRGEVLETAYSRQMTTGGGKRGQGYPAVRQETAVRRLTPRECERLQAFPDDWTRWKRAGGQLTEQSDSARYRQVGNAVTVNVPEWIIRRLAAAHAARAEAGAA